MEQKVGLVKLDQVTQVLTFVITLQYLGKDFERFRSTHPSEDSQNVILVREWWISNCFYIKF